MIFVFNKFILFKYIFDVGNNTPYVIVFSSIFITMVLWIVVALFTKPEPDKTLKTFYERAKPFGCWRPISGIGSQNKWLKCQPIVRGFLIAFVGSVMISAGTIGLNALYIAQWKVVFFAWTISIVSIIVFKIYYRQFMSSMINYIT